MSAPKTITLDITILGREFKVACKEREREELLEAVALLDKRMREIRDAGKVTGTDRIAVMAALNFAHELLRERRAAGTGSTPAAAEVRLTVTPRGVESSRCNRQSTRRSRGKTSCSRNPATRGRERNVFADCRRWNLSRFGGSVVPSPAVFDPAIRSLNQCSRSEVAAPYADRCALPRGSA